MVTTFGKTAQTCLLPCISIVRRLHLSLGREVVGCIYIRWLNYYCVVNLGTKTPYHMPLILHYGASPAARAADELNFMIKSRKWILCKQMDVLSNAEYEQIVHGQKQIIKRLEARQVVGNYSNIYNKNIGK